MRLIFYIAFISILVINYSAEANARTNIVIGVYNRITTIDPIRLNNKDDLRLAHALYDKLVNIDQFGVIVPEVALYWEVKSGGREYTFYLDTSKRFSDGSAVTADDVIFSIERAKNRPDAIASNFFECIYSIKANSSNSITIRLKRVFTPFLHILATMNSSIVKRDSLDTIFENYSGPFSGPYKIINVEKDNLNNILKVNLARNEYYNEQVKTDNITFLYIDESDILDSIKNHKIDCIDNISESLAMILRNEREFSNGVKYIPTFGVSFIFLNPSNKIFSDPIFRRKILTIAHSRHSSMAISNKYVYTDQLLPKGMTGYVDNFAIDKYLDNALLGNKMGLQKVNLYYIYKSIEHNPILLELFNKLSEYNIDTKLRFLPRTHQNLMKYYGGHLPAGVVEIIQPISDPFFLFSLFDKRIPYSLVNYNNLKYEQLLSKAISADESKRPAMYELALRYLLKDAIIIPISEVMSISYCDENIDNQRRFASEAYIYKKLSWMKK